MKSRLNDRVHSLRSLGAIEDAMQLAAARPFRGERAIFEKPHPGTEAALARMWASILGIEHIGRLDQFFLLGGHSLQATRVLAMVRDQLGKEPPLSDIFEAPVLADFAAKLDASGATGVSGIPVVPRDGELPLSYAQQRLWFLNQYEAARGNYNIVVRLKMTGAGVSQEALARVLSRLVERHEPLRTVFCGRGSAVHQLIQPACEVPIQFANLPSEPSADSELAAWRLLDDDAVAPFDLAEGLMLRAVLLHQGPQEYLLQLTMHHIASDGWSLGVVVQDVIQIYRAQMTGEQEILPRLPVQYADYAAWQRLMLQDAALERQLSYWRRQLQGLSARIELPTDRPRPALQTYAGTSLEFLIPLSLRERLGDVAGQQGATLFMVLHAAFSILLHRYSGQQDICIGTPVAGRARTELEGLVGCFVNTLVLRTSVEPGVTFSAFLQAVKKTDLDAYAHQDVPIEKLVEELRPARSLSHSPLFQVMFALQNAPRYNLELAGITFEAQPFVSRIARFDITCTLAENAGGLIGTLEYNTDLFDEATIRRLARHYQMLLHGICAHPDTKVGDLALLTPEEERQILLGWNDTEKTYKREMAMHQLFEKQVRSCPEAVAVIYEDEKLTYGELNARANQLARHLRNLGIGPDTLVGVCVERGTQMLVGLLGILKAGGAYVPLDPTYPCERLAFMLQDAAPIVLVTQERLLAQLPSCKAKVVCLDRSWPQMADYAQEDLETLTKPEHLAYVIYTSGSTGQPKGVAVQQLGLSNFLQAMAGALELTIQDAVLGLTSLSFDIAALELFLPLVIGARVVLASAGHAQDPQRLCRLLEQHRVSLVQATPSSWHMLINQGWSPSWPVKALCGGEALSAVLMRTLTDKFGAVWNMYGPTETTIWSSLARLDAQATRPNIGQPIANTRIHILDPQLRLVPVGIAGELHIGGEGLARGYLNRPELTAGRFIPDPFGAEGTRLYKTGDLARYLADGNIEYLGRIDNQVKLRGFRIELGEIESVLEQQPEVDRAAVMMREDQHGDKRLVAYVVGREGQHRKALDAALSRRLPAHMLPHVYVFLDALPTTPNGKLDRKALPAPRVKRDVPRNFEEPRTDDERRLAQLWREILMLDTIGLHDDFFELGGHSLLVLELASRISKEFGKSVEVAEFFRHSTLVDQAMLLEEARLVDDGDEHTLKEQSIDYALTPGQRRLWLFQQMFPANCAYHMSGTINVPTDVVLDALRLREIVRVLQGRHDALRLVFRQVDNEPRQSLHPDMALDLAFCELSEESAFNERSAAFVRAPFNLAEGPLFRILCTSLPKGQRIVWVIHHIVGDGVSLKILADELKVLLEAPVPIPKTDSQHKYGFLDFVREQSDIRRHDAARAYWTEKFQSPPARVELPFDHSVGRAANSALAAFAIKVPSEVLAAVREMCIAERITPFTVLYAAFAVLLHKITGACDLVVGVPFAGRSDAKTRDVVGFFVNTAAMRTSVDPQGSFRELVRHVKTDLFQAFRHQDYPFDQLVEDIGVPIETGRFPLTPIFLNMLTLTASETELMQLQPGHRVVRGDAKFDMDWYLLKREGSLLLDCHYRSALFMPETVEFIAGAYVALLSHLTEDADASLVSCVLRAESPATSGIVAHTPTPGTMPRSVAEAFVRIAAQHPRAIALRCGTSVLTYGELDARRCFLAARLRQFGVEAGARVALLYQPSEDMIVAVLAALTVGATYVPLDPHNPAIRLAAICADCAPAILLAGEDCRSVAEQLASATGVPLRSGVTWPIEKLASSGIPAAIDGSGGYILYTSGSTGRAKGVLQSQSNALQHAQTYIASLSLDTRDNLLLLASYAFDAALMDIFGALLSGATLTIVDPRSTTPVALRRLINESGVTVLHATPTMFRYFLADGAVLHGLRWVVLGGEAATQRDMKIFESSTNPECRLVNGLGPTECTLALQFQTVHGRRVPHPVPVGFPVPGVEVILEGEDEGPLAFHSGEIILRSEALAQRYWGLPEATAAAFMVDAHGRRCYRTGDLGRRWIDGSIRPLGRRDQQLKIRGVRIEAMEVEQAIRAVDGVAECVCRGEPGVGGETELIAYCEWKANAAPDYRALRNAVAQMLPSSMWPSRYCTVDQIILTATGKIDRARVHENARPALESPTLLPSRPLTHLESVVCAAVGRILKKHEVSPADNFFVLGGDSLQALRLVAIVSAEIGVEIPLSELFGAPTLGEVADVIERQVMLRALVNRAAPTGNVETFRF